MALIGSVAKRAVSGFLARLYPSSIPAERSGQDQAGYEWGGTCWLAAGKPVCPKLDDQLQRQYLKNWFAMHGNDTENGVGVARVKKMARQYLSQHPTDTLVVTVLCSALLAQGKAQLAIITGIPHLREGNSPLRSTMQACISHLERAPRTREFSHIFARTAA